MKTTKNNNLKTLESIKKYAIYKMQYAKGGDDMATTYAGPFDMDCGPIVPTLRGAVTNAGPFDMDYGPIVSV